MPKNAKARRRTSGGLEFGGTFELDWKGGQLADIAWDVARETLIEAVDEIVGEMKQRVAVGRGPKPHVTPKEKMGRHEGTLFASMDTGKLAESITASVSKKSGFLIASIWSDTAKTDGVPYGMYLELGFHPTDPFLMNRRFGSFYRYPWFSSSLEAILPGYREYIPARLRYHLQDLVAKGKKKKYVKILRPITDTAGIMLQLQRGLRDLHDQARRAGAYGYDGRDDIDDDLMRLTGRNINK